MRVRRGLGVAVLLYIGVGVVCQSACIVDVPLMGCQVVKGRRRCRQVHTSLTQRGRIHPPSSPPGLGESLELMLYGFAFAASLTSA